MHEALRAALDEIIGLFVDDWAIALLTLAWIGLFALPGVRAHAALAAVTLLAGLAALTLVFVARKARR